MQQAVRSSYQVIHGRHTILAGPAKGLCVCVCLECGKHKCALFARSLTNLVVEEEACQL